MKKLLTIVLTLTLLLAVVPLMSVSAAADITDAFTDANFRAEVYAAIGKTAPAPILDTDVAAVTKLDVWACNIADMAGLEYFTALEELNCSYNKLEQLDVSHNTELVRIYCFNNKLDTLDVSKNTKLEYLDCSGNNLTVLDVSKNAELQTLDCGDNKLTALDIRSNTELVKLICWANKLDTLDVSKNTKLEYLDCGENNLTALDVSKNATLEYLDCSGNRLPNIGAVIGLDRSKTDLDFYPQQGMERIRGDVNFDGLIDSTDARMVLQKYVGLIRLDEGQLLVARVSGEEGHADSTDARMILQFYVGLIEEFPEKSYD